MTALRTALRESVAMQDKSELGKLLTRYRHADENWTPENDGLTLDISDEIKVLLMADYGLSKAEVDTLGRAL